MPQVPLRADAPVFAADAAPGSSTPAAPHLLQAHQDHGYACEATPALLAHARDTLALLRLCAIVLPRNARSTRLLEALGFAAQGRVRIAAGAHAVELYARDLPAPAAAPA
ncbi:GNAT family N-acetyltransferase [Xanthomonas hyacinthi]|uniref:N-acetyltransferase domain-containing protein n=1 Tax=Xanthomonas hyacinthi TaxID=56455 RepID=A0A2S7ER83_9XANT|nr:GNAT family protein [Xanthomonas hyacinthi]PPU95625.1 hypothetical protein XhyaCFBP1156_18260 [Xanthomonas hyacinthi]QGY77020.1 GNAT family N-acetyltransferase [Xanthomonas hyacinthi]